MDDILRKAGWEMPRQVVSIVSVGVGFATCYGDARQDSRTRQIRGDVEVQQLISGLVTVSCVRR